jgi:hypothetical protein
VDAHGYQHGFLYENGTYLTVDAPGAFSTVITSVNDAGQIAGYYYNSTGIHDFTADPTTLTLSDGTTVTGGTISVGVFDTMEVERGPSGSGATLNGVSVTNDGIIKIDPAAGTVLTLEGGASISGGTLTIGPVGTLDVESEGGAALHGVTVNLDGALDLGDVAPETILILDGGVTINGSPTGSLTINESTDLDIEAGGDGPTGATFHGVNVLTTADLTSAASRPAQS